MKFDIAVCLIDIRQTAAVCLIDIRQTHSISYYFLLKLFPVLFSQLWETTKVHTSSAICLKRDSDVLFDQEEIIISAADNCNRLQVSLRPTKAV